MDIVFDMLSAISNKGGRIIPTHLLYKSNLSHIRMKQYLAELTGRGFVQEGSEKGRRVILITDAGREFLANYRRLKEFTDAFGF